MSEPESPEAEAFTFDGDSDDGIAGMAKWAICRGTLDECLAAVWRQPDEVRAIAYISSAEWTFVPNEIEAMRREAGVGGAH